MVHAQVSDKYIHFSLMYTTDNILHVLTIKLGKSGQWTDYATQNSNWNKTFIIKPTCFILSMCCTKVKRTCLHKGIKHVSLIIKRFVWRSLFTILIYQVFDW